MPGYEVIGEEERREVLEVLNRKVLFRYDFHAQREGDYKVEAFEKAFARRCGVHHALAVSSGTAALRVALAALGVGPGDEVVTQGFTFVATWEAILDCGATPVFAEIDDTLCMDPKDLERRIGPRTRAVLPVHMCGGQGRIPEIVAVAGRHGVPVIEDTAQACGGTYEGRALGSFGTIGCFSFDAVKTLTTGEGGMLVMDDGALYTRASEFHDHGHDHNPRAGGRGLEGRNFVGFNYRMMELQGALGLAQLGKLDAILERQRRNKARLREALKGVPGVTFRTLPDPAGDIGSFLMFFLPSRDQALAFKKGMAEAGYGPVYWHDNLWHYYRAWEHLLEGKSAVRTGYPFRHETGLERLGFSRDALPRTEEILARCLTIPIAIDMDKGFEGIEKALGEAAKVL